MADRFYTDLPLASGEFTLTGTDAHHLVAVRRFTVGDPVTLFNGDGDEYPAEVVSADRRRVVLIVGSAIATSRELGFELVVAAAIPKADRADFLVEKLTELGVTRFVPLLTARSIVTPTDAKGEKFRRAVIESSKQCGRNRLMIVDPPTRFEDFVIRAEPSLLRLLLHTGDGRRPTQFPIDSVRAGVTVAIGPEGGFTPGEVDAAAAVGWQTLSLGSRVLRIETAALASAAWFASVAAG